MNIDIPLKVKFKGRFRLQVKSTSGEVTQDTGWFDNLITNQGLNWLGGGAPNYNVSYGQPYVCTHCGVGTGSTAPAVTDTLLTSFTAMYPTSASSNVEGFSSNTYVAGPPAYWSGIFTYNFATGAVVANIAEVGCGNTAIGNTQPQLFSHALIVDSLGHPTTITLTATDALVVNYELRMYLDLTDNTYSMNVSGTTYTGTYRRAQITTPPNFAYTASWGGVGGAIFAYVYNGTIDVVTYQPSGSSDGGTSFTYGATAYTAGSHYSTISFTAPLGYGNLSGGITAIMVQCNHGNYQFGVSPAIPKTAIYTLTINWNASWSRYP